MSRPLAAITGASSGIGLTFAQRLAPTHDLLLIARRGDLLHTLATDLATRHATHVDTLAADLTLPSDLAAATARLAAAPTLSLLINNAGFGLGGAFWKIPLESQQRMHRLHIDAVLALTHAALNNMTTREATYAHTNPHTRPPHTGSRALPRHAIINVASVAAFIRRPRATSYNATKAWMTAFTESLHLELRAAGSAIQLQALCPGYTFSGFHDTMGIDRRKLAPASMWMTSEAIVDASLRALPRGTLFVIPGWRYRSLVSLFSRIPDRLRLRLESTAVTGPPTH